MQQRNQLHSCLLTLVLGASAATAASAQTTIDLAATSGGASTIYVLPGDSVPYEVSASLSGDASQGLALFVFDLDFTGGDLTQQAQEPIAGDLLQFVAPLGFNNPEGYGGTLRGGNLLQVGGGMNTIANQFAPSPSGVVATGLGLTGAEQVATGSLTAPMAPGTYELRIENVFANALVTQDPTGFWRVKAAEDSGPAPLVIEVLDCVATSYCTGKLSSTGCIPDVAAVGIASISGSGAVTVTASDVVNGQTGLFLWSRSDGQMPLFGGTLCVGSPFSRMLEPARSGGAGVAGTTCDGSFTRTIDAAFLAGSGLALGETLFCQWIFRDPGQLDGTGVGLTNAARVSICP